MLRKFIVISMAVTGLLAVSGLRPVPAVAGGGGCCYTNGDCAQFPVDQTTCEGGGGTWDVGIVTCSPNPCPQPAPTTTTTTPPTTSTTTSTTSTTMLPVSGACCTPSGCQDTNLGAGYCETELTGTYQGDGTACTEPNICAAPTTTTTMSEPTTTTTTSEPTTTTTTLAVTGACCTRTGCSDVKPSLCEVGFYQGDGTSCTEPDICGGLFCGDGCVDFGEQCDDGGTGTGDGCGADCKEEACFDCGVLQGAVQTVCANGLIGGCCPNPSQCVPVGGPGCSTCGNGVVEPSETCDDSNTANGDCCSSTCQLDQTGTPCPNSSFCDGVETCDGKGGCTLPGTPPSCTNFDGPCSVGECDAQLNACHAVAANEGGECATSGACQSASGACANGLCVGQGTTLSPTCRWIIVGGLGGINPKVRVHNGSGSTMKEPAMPPIPNLEPNICGDTGKSAGETDGSFVVTADMGEGIRFYHYPVIQDDIATGGSSLGAKLYSEVPGTGSNAPIPGGQMVAKDPTGMIDTTGASQKVADCLADQQKLEDAIAVLDAKPTTQVIGDPGHGLKIPVGSSPTPIDVTGLNPGGVVVLETASLKLSHGATLTLKGGPSDVVMVRITGGRFKMGFGSKLVLDGLKPENVLVYSQWQLCRISPGVVGAGTVFCPNAARKFLVGFGAKWSGTILGGAKEIRVRVRAELTHVPFTGF